MVQKYSKILLLFFFVIIFLYSPKVINAACSGCVDGDPEDPAPISSNPAAQQQAVQNSITTSSDPNANPASNPGAPPNTAPPSNAPPANTGTPSNPPAGTGFNGVSPPGPIVGSISGYWGGADYVANGSGGWLAVENAEGHNGEGGNNTPSCPVMSCPSSCGYNGGMVSVGTDSGGTCMFTSCPATSACAPGVTPVQGGGNACVVASSPPPNQGGCSGPVGPSSVAVGSTNSYSVTSSAPGHYSWQVNNQVQGYVSTTMQFHPTQPGTYTITYIDYSQDFGSIQESCSTQVSVTQSGVSCNSPTATPTPPPGSPPTCSIYPITGIVSVDTPIHLVNAVPAVPGYSYIWAANDGTFPNGSYGNAVDYLPTTPGTFSNVNLYIVDSTLTPVSYCSAFYTIPPVTTTATPPTAILQARVNGVLVGGNNITINKNDRVAFREAANAYAGQLLTNVSVITANKATCSSGAGGCNWATPYYDNINPNANSVDRFSPEVAWDTPGTYYVIIGADANGAGTPRRCSGNEYYTYNGQTQFARCDSSNLTSDHITITVNDTPPPVTNNYFTTATGDVFSGGNIANSVVQAGPNASYAVSAFGTIGNFSTALKDSAHQWLLRSYPIATNQKYNYEYFAALPVTHKTDYPTLIVTDSNFASYFGSANSTTGDGVYGINGDLQMDLSNGSFANGRTIIFLVKGDLKLNTTIGPSGFYPAPGNILFIVQKNIYIGNQVDQLHAFFISNQNFYTCGNTPGLSCSAPALTVYGGVVSYGTVNMGRIDNKGGTRGEGFYGDPAIMYNIQKSINFGTASYRFSEQAP